jgi:hypothetical protein
LYSLDVEVGLDEEFLQKCIVLKIDLDVIFKLYLTSYSAKKYFDYRKEILKIFVEKNRKYLYEFLNHSFDRSSYSSLEYENLEFVWELEKYDEIIIGLTNLEMFKNPLSEFKSGFSAFFPKNYKEAEEKLKVFFENAVEFHHNNKLYMISLFNVACYLFPDDNRNDLLKSFLSKNLDIDTFKRLDLIKNRIMQGGVVPYYEEYKESWCKILNVIDSLKNKLEYIKHKKYAEQQIRYYDEAIRHAIKREFQEQ